MGKRFSNINFFHKLLNLFKQIFMNTIYNKRSVAFILIFFIFIRLNAQQPDTVSAQKLFDLSLEDLMNIEIVSATQKAQNITEAPSVITLITSTQIKERGYLSVAEALNSIAGIDIIKDHYQPNAGIRGVNGGLRSWSRLFKVMVDGQSMSLRSNSDNYLDASFIPIEAIDKIEIIRGPNSALYGKNAFLGVINIITRSGKTLKNNTISHYLSNIQDVASYGINTIWGGEKNNYDVLFASNFEQINYAPISPQNVPGSAIYSSADKSQKNEGNPLSLFFKANYTSEELGNFTIDATQQIINSFAEFVDWGSLSHNNRISIFNGYERLSYTNTFLDDFETYISLAHATGKPLKKEILDIDQDPSQWIERDFEYTSYDLNGKIAYSFDEINNLTLGIDYTSDNHQHQKYYTVSYLGTRTLNPGGTDGKTNFNNLGIYLQMILNPAIFFNFGFLEELTFTAGYRFDYHNIYGDVLTYRLAAVYQFNKQLSTKLMYGTSFNAPSPVQLYTNYIAPGGIVGNPDLKPEKAKTLEWALTGKVFKNLNFNTNLFYTHIDDKIEYLLPYGQISNITAENISNIHSAGVETELSTNIYNNSAYLNYSYQRSIIEKNDPILQKIQVKTPLYPEHMIKFGDVFYMPKYKISLNLEGVYVSSRIASDQNNFIYDPINYSTNRYKLDPYISLDLMISTTELEIIKNSKTKISVKIENILNNTYYYPGFKNYDIPCVGRTYFFRFIHYI